MAMLAAGTTPNGVFGAKLMWTVVAAADPLHLPDPHFVWLRRDDDAAQAVSFWRAVASGHWHMWDPPPREAEFDRDAIAHLLGEIREQNAAWPQRPGRRLGRAVPSGTLIRWQR